MGAVLMQEATNGIRRTVFYASAKFSPAESSYHCNEHECLVIIWTIKRYGFYREDAPFTLWIDSKNTYVVHLSEGYFKVEHVPGKNNDLPNSLSRHPNPYEMSPGEADLE